MTMRPSLGNISSRYGWRTHPITGARSHHDGEDIGWAAGLTLVAPTDSRVISYGRAGGYGNRLVLRAGLVDVWLCHMAAASVRVGQHVAEGQPVGTMGATGNALGVHVHWEIHRAGTRVDPASFLTSPAQTTLTPIEMENEMKIIAPYGMPDRGIIGPGFGLAFGNEGDFQHFTNVWAMNRNAVTIVGDPSMSEAARRTLFQHIISLHRSGSSTPPPTAAAIASALVKVLPGTPISALQEADLVRIGHAARAAIIKD